MAPSSLDHIHNLRPPFHRPYISRMVNGLNATTPQLKFMERLIEAYTTRDINNVGPFLSKNYKNQSFPKVAHLPDHTKGEHVQLFGPLLMAMTKIEVRTYLTLGNRLRVSRLISTCRPQYFCHEVIDAPGKLVLHVRSYLHTCHKHTVSNQNAVDSRGYSS